jgi:hypothetical protein
MVDYVGWAAGRAGRAPGDRLGSQARSPPNNPIPVNRREAAEGKESGCPSRRRYRCVTARACSEELLQPGSDDLAGAVDALRRGRPWLLRTHHPRHAHTKPAPMAVSTQARRTRTPACSSSALVMSHSMAGRHHRPVTRSSSRASMRFSHHLDSLNRASVIHGPDELLRGR